ncbi:hypothetical protein Tco_1011781 [Tanacetum coccineum]
MNPRVSKDNVTKGTTSKKNNPVDKEGFIEVRNKRNVGGQIDMGNKGVQGNNQAFRKEVGTKNDNIKFAYILKILDPKPLMKENVTLKHKSRVDSIYGEDGKRYDGDEVLEQFVQHFNKFLRTSMLVMPLNLLEDNVNLELTCEEIDEMIKSAHFDIDSSKATRSDGYSASFFKKSWQIVGKEIYELLMLCNGEIESLKVVKKSLDEFSRVSGLYQNLSKSTIFFGSVSDNDKADMMQILPFKYGKLPMKIFSSSIAG